MGAGLKIGIGIGRLGADALEVVLGGEAFDEVGGAVVGQGRDPGGEPVFEPCEGLVAAGVHHAVMDEQSPEVFGGVRAGETVEGFVGERQFAGADGFQQGPGPGAWAHVGVDAFGSLGCGEHFDEPVQA